MKKTLFILLSVGAMMCACTKKTPPVEVRKSLFHNPDSLLFYAERAYLHDDPKGLYITAVASLMKAQQPDFPDSLTVVPVDEAEIMLLRSAQLGYPEAEQLIHCLADHGQWHHSMPEK